MKFTLDINRGRLIRTIAAPGLSLLIACSSSDINEIGPIAKKEDSTTETLSGKQFTTEEMSSFKDVLNLKQRLLNYANIEIPKYFDISEGSYPENDNTPADNPITDEGATLGRVLFYDKNLSINNTISCASCHHQDKGFSDPEQFSTGFNGGKTRRNSMTLINSRWYGKGRFFWDERAATLEDQVLMPIQDHVEMGLSLSEMTTKLAALPYYPVLFNKAFGSTEVTSDRVSKALAQFVRSIVSVDSKFQKAVRADSLPEVEILMPRLSQLSKLENDGLDLFYTQATCSYCHLGSAHVADSAKNNGLALFYEDNGRGEWSGNASEMATFKVPSLANIALTAPYMHDGRFATLREVMDHYSDNIKAHPSLNSRLTMEDRDGTVGGTPTPFEFDEYEKEAIIAFLNTLTDETIATNEKYSDPFVND